jgi:7-cyano-7-deazaguanine synthase
MGKPAVVLLSGGMDSAVCLAVAQRDGFDAWPLSFDYGQRHRLELDAARAVAAARGVPAERHRVIDLSGVFSGSALTGDAPVPLDRREEEMAQEIPATYVPARNLVFLSLAAALAEPAGAEDVFLGVNALDYSGYPDCRPEFLAAFEAASRQGMRRGVRVHAPLLRLSKAEIVRLGVALGAPLDRTLSCYLGQRPACGRCDACRLRRKGFAEAGLTDPIPYASA